MLPMPGTPVFYRPEPQDTARTNVEWWAAIVTGIDLDANTLSLLATNPGGGLLSRSGVSEGSDAGQYSRELLTALASPPLPGFGFSPNTIASGIISTETKYWGGSGFHNVSSGNDPGEVEFDLVNTEVGVSEILIFQGIAINTDGTAPMLVIFGGDVVTGRRRIHIYDRKGVKSDGIVTFRIDRLETPTESHQYT